ncbi:MAG: DUF3501 family protein [Fimbriiglobus sp.]|jgi:hypothetical protein|nr:DUF3501 family protein [Fimbriiglobus sp.]
MTRTTLPRLGSPAVSALRLTQSPSVESAHKHLTACRRVTLGDLSVVFEDRQTVWFRVQELARCGRGGEHRRQLDWYEQLMPGGGRVTAAVWLNARGRRADDLRDEVNASRLVLTSDAGHRVEGVYLSQRVTDRLIGLVRWVEFRFTAEDREALHDPRIGWELRLESDGRTLSVKIDEGVLESLSADVG